MKRLKTWHFEEGSTGNKHININLQHDLCFLEFPGSIIPSFVIKLVVLIFLKGRIVIQFEP